MNNYEDIINIEYVPDNKMTLNNRAAQFMPFSALVGYSEAIKEKEIIKTKQKELTNEEKIELNNKILKLNKNDLISATYFIEEQGGRYIKIKGRLKKIDIDNKLINIDNKIIKINDIIDLTY